MGQDWLLYGAVWVASASGAYLIAKGKGDPERTRWAVAGLLLGPLGVLLALFLAKPEGPSSAARATPAAGPMPAGAAPAAGPMPSAAFCPQCGAKRLGSYRFCTTCKFDYDTGAPSTPPRGVAAPQPLSAAASTSSASSYWRAILVIVGLLAAVFVGMQVLSKAAPTVPSFAGSSNLPPAGSIWFGSSFDTSTFEVRGKLTTTSVQDTVAVVAHLSSAANGSQLNVRTSYDGAVLSNVAFNADGTSDVWGWTVGPLFLAGPWTIELTDIGGNVLAQGTITVTE